MAKLTLSTVSSGYADVSLLNTNFQAIIDEFQKCVYRDGENPSELTADLDANSNQVINLSHPPVNNTDAATKLYVDDTVNSGISIGGLAADSAPAESDLLVFYDVSEEAHNSATIAEVVGQLEFEDLGDVTLSSIADNEIIQWDAGTSSFINRTWGEVEAELEAVLDHDQLQGFVANEHVDHSSVSILAGTALTGGGDLTASRTLNVDETAINHDNLSGFVAAEHLDWSADQGATNIHTGNITSAAVTQHQGSLSITESQISDLGNYAVVGHTHSASDTTSGTFDDARISESSVTQHYDAMSKIPVKAEAGTSRTVAASDLYSIIRCTSASATTITIPASINDAGAWIMIIQDGGGQVTVAGSGGNNIVSANGAKTAAQESGICAINTSGSNWHVFGDATA